MRGQKYDYGTMQSSSFRVDRRELNLLMKLLDNGQSVHVTGGRKLGKTVLLQQAKTHLEERVASAKQIIVPVYQDLQIMSQQPSASLLFGTLSRKVAVSFDGLLRRLGTVTTCQRPPDTWRHDPSIEFIDYLNTLLDDLDVVIGRLRLVFLLDECEALIRSSEAHILLGNLRALTGPETNNRVQLVATGFRDLKEYQDPETGTSPFTNVLESLSLGLLKEDEFTELVEPLITNLPAAEQESMIHKIWAATGGHPCIIHTLCGHLTEIDADLNARFEAASKLTTDRLRGQVFSSWVNQFRDKDYELFEKVLHTEHCPQNDTASEEFLLYCGVITVKAGILNAPCGLFNKWYESYTGAATYTIQHGVSGIPIPAAVKKAYQENKLVVFVGSGLSLGRDVVGNFPSWGELPQRLLDACERYEVLTPNAIQAKRVIFEAPMNLEQMLRELDTLRGALNRKYRRALNEIFRPKDAKPGAVHEAVMALGVLAVLTTNYDSLLEIAEKSGHRPCYTWKDATSVLADLQEGRKVLFKIHGSAERHDSVIMSYLEYEGARNDKAYQSVVNYLLQDNVFLFIGYGMNDPLDLDRALGGNVDSFQEASQRHYVLLRQASQTDIDRYERNFNVQVIAYTEHEQVPQFLYELAQ